MASSVEPERIETVPVGFVMELATATSAMTWPLAMTGFCARLRVVVLVARVMVSAMGAALEAALSVSPE